MYNRDCRIKQCFNCYKYGHLSTRCTNKTSCGRCAHSHETPMREKSQSECLNSHSDKCVNCDQNHTSYSKTCSHRQKKYERIKIIKMNTPKRYTKKMWKSTYAIQCQTRWTWMTSSQLKHRELKIENQTVKLTHRTRVRYLTIKQQRNHISSTSDAKIAALQFCHQKRKARRETMTETINRNFQKNEYLFANKTAFNWIESRYEYEKKNSYYC